MAKVQTNGMTLTFATASGYVPDIISYSKDGETADDVETSDLSTLDFRTYEPGFLVEGGTYTFELQLDTTFVRLATGLTDTVTITYPISVSGNTAATEIFQGYINSYSESGGINELISATLVLKVADTPVFTEEMTP